MCLLSYLKGYLELSKNFHLTKLSDYRDLENDMKGVCLTCVQTAGVDLTAIILSCLFHLFVTVAAEGRADDAMLAFCFI